MKTKGERSYNRMERKNSRIDKRVSSLNKRSNRITDKASSTNTLVMNGMTANLKSVDRSKLSDRQNKKVDRLKSRARTLSDKKVLSPAEAISSGKTKNLSDMKNGNRKERRIYKSVVKNSEASKVPNSGKMTNAPVKSNPSQSDKFNKLKDSVGEKKVVRFKF